MYKKKLIILNLFIISLAVNAQSQSSSPYSLFGLGQENSNYFGGFSALGNTGVGYSSPFSINKSNVASLTSIQANSFLYEFGFSSVFSTNKNKTTSNKNFTSNFSHLAFAFKIKDYWKTSFGLIPYSKVSYNLTLEQPIEGTISTYFTNVIGSGGINEVFWGNGLKLSKRFSVGIELKALFGSINEEQLISSSAASVDFTKVKHYSGLGLSIGMQYKINNLFGYPTTIGATLNLPTSLSGSEDLTGSKTLTTSSSISFLDLTNQSIAVFNLPLKIGTGISTSIIKNLIINADFQKNYWANIYNSNSTYSFINQTIYGIGAEYSLLKNRTNFWNSVKYRAGLNYNSGYLKLNNQTINNYSFNLGLGIPLSKSTNPSMLNINYSYGREGTLNNNLIQENYNKLSINFSFLGNWFQKKKIF